MGTIFRSHRIEAARLLFALEIEIERPGTVVQWADDIIGDELDPPYEIIEVSLANSEDLKTLMSLLGTIGSVEDRGDAIRCALGRLAFLAERDVSMLRRILKSLRWSPLDISEFLDDDFISCVAEDYSLAEDGIFGSVEDLDNELKQYLNQFATEQSSARNWYAFF